MRSVYSILSSVNSSAKEGNISSQQKPEHPSSHQVHDTQSESSEFDELASNFCSPCVRMTLSELQQDILCQGRCINFSTFFKSTSLPPKADQPDVLRSVCRKNFDEVKKYDMIGHRHLTILKMNSWQSP